MHSVLEQRKQWQKQYISVGKTDLFYNSMGLCGNFTKTRHTTAEISERSDVIRAFQKRPTSSRSFARSAQGLNVENQESAKRLTIQVITYFRANKWRHVVSSPFLGGGRVRGKGTLMIVNFFVSSFIFFYTRYSIESTNTFVGFRIVIAPFDDTHIRHYRLIFRITKQKQWFLLATRVTPPTWRTSILSLNFN